MAMRRILYERGGIYHVGNEGAHGAPIALDEHDLTSLARELRSAAAAYRVRLLAWCVLPCSYQLLAQPLGDPSVSLFLQCVFNRYSKRFNHRHSRSGSLFAGPYSAERIDNDRRLALLCRRVHLLPVIHGCAATPELWPHSDFAEWIDATICMRPLQHLDAQTYAAFVEAGRMH